MSALSFDHANHTYTLGSRKLPGVTTILKPLYSDLKFVSEDLLQYKSELGTAVHTAVELDVKGRLAAESVVDPVAAYYQQWRRFLADTGFTPIDSEVRVHSMLGYAGTLDLTGLLSQRKVMIDVKTTATISPAVALQLAAYQRAYNEQREAKEHALARFALRLTPNDYKLVPFTGDAADFSAFVAFLKVHQWTTATRSKLELPQ